EKLTDSSERTRLAFIALQDMITDAKIPDEQIVCNVGVGNAKDEMLEYARQIDADLIAIASHRPNVSSYLLGSPAASIVRHAKMSVLVIR
ncbi:universal stress protein, partial [Proteus mirabilis]|uniref:universal stress protein n=1 Tax=Proteus mirabilis TaxID=584 RepID=UPI00257581E1